MKPLMSTGQINLIEKYLSDKDVFFEWGSGGSTVRFSEKVKRLISVEHNKAWYDRVKNYIEKKGIKNVDLNFMPKIKDKCIIEQYREYIEFPITNNIKFSRVLIDGRMRRRCAMSILPVINSNTVVFMHDFQRKYYHAVLEYFDIIESSTGLVVLKKKP